MSQLDKALNETNPDYIYYDLLFTNQQSTTTIPPVFQYNDTRTAPYVMKPDDYALSIIRFTVDTGSLPVFIPTIVADPDDDTNVNYTIYTVSLEFDGQVATKHITWAPQDSSAPIPVPPQYTTTGVQDNSNGYYNCYSYNYFTFLVYTAIQEAFLDLTGLDPEILPPFINWDSSSNRAVLNAQSPYYDIGVGPDVKIYMNNPLYNLFSSFPARFFGSTLDSDRNVQLLVANIAGINTYQPIDNPTVTYIQMFQEYSTVSSWTPITSIVFTSTTLPINGTQVSVPIVVDNGVILPSSTQNNATANIITDLVSDTGEYKPNLVYLPTAQYRYITLFGNTPLVNLDIQIFYKLRDGTLVPFRLTSGGTVTVKLAFIKKGSLGKNSLS
jgi:hypothetical protein